MVGRGVIPRSLAGRPHVEPEWNPNSRPQHSRAGLRYGSDLTDAECAILA
jgi:hypothetical protein